MPKIILIHLICIGTLAFGSLNACQKKEDHAKSSPQEAQDSSASDKEKSELKTLLDVQSKIQKHFTEIENISHDEWKGMLQKAVDENTTHFGQTPVSLFKPQAHEDEFILLAHYLEMLGEHEKARTIYDDGLIVFPANAAITAAYRKNLIEDKDLYAPPQQWFPDKDLSAIKKQGGGSTLVFRGLMNGEIVGAIKPQQTRLQSNYRSEIAAYRLCPLIHCQFNVPKNIHIYLEYNHFVGLYSRLKSNPRGELADLTYTKDKETNKDYVHATLKDWIHDFTQFPIELSSVWKPWLNTIPKKELKTRMATEAIPVYVKRHPLGDKRKAEWEAHLKDVTLYDLSMQISNMFVFDFLSNNWDRFSGVPRFWGVNCQFKDGKFMSIDNGAAFPKTPNPKPLKNLNDISRFSKRTIDAIKSLDYEYTLNFLFPDPSNFEKEKFETFWMQRKRLLEIVDQCIEQKGEEECIFYE